MDLFKQKFKQNHSDKEQPKGARKKRSWLHRKDDDLQEASGTTNATDKVRKEDRLHSNHDKISDSNSPDASTPEASAKVPEKSTNASEMGGFTSIWGRAYDSLKNKSTALVTEYEELLSEAHTPDTTNGPPDKGKPLNMIAQNDPRKRQLQMDEMMKDGQSRMEEKKIKYQFLGKEHAFEDDVASAVNVVLWAKDWIGEALKFSPEASMIWAGVSTILPLLTNPSTSSKANSEGFEYVTSRLRYYVAFEKLLLPDHQDTRISEGLRKEFEKHVEDLYEHILEFQLRSILRFYRWRLGNLGRDMFQLEAWNKMVSDIKDRESIVDRESNQIYTAVSFDELKGISSSAKELVHITKERADYRTTKEERECHQFFRLTDTSKPDAKTEGRSGYEEYKNRVESRVEGTCQWFLDQENFKHWLKEDSGLLLVTADPGCGKSVLAKYLIDSELPSHTREPAAICYFFFKDQIQSDIHHALCALLHQLFSQRPSLIRHAIKARNENGPELMHIPEKLWEILQNASRDDEAGQVICVLDALDECDESHRETLTTLLKTHFHLNPSTRGKLKMLLTSRPYERVTSGFDELAELFPNMRIPGEDESPRIAEEINAVIKHRVRKFQQKRRLKEGSLDYLEKRLMQIEHRTYLWLYLVFGYLENHLVKWTEKAMQKEVFDNVPVSFDNAYERILEKSRDKEKAMKIFNILLTAFRPLTLGEMQIAFEIDRTSSSLSDLDLEDVDQFEKSLREYCGLFVSINSGKVYFLHQTAREFLLPKMQSEDSNCALDSNEYVFRHSISIQQAHSLLAESCMAYVKFPDWPKEKKNDDKESTDWDMGDQHANEHSFLDYASTYWAIHLRQAGDIVDEAIQHGSLELCNIRSKSFYPWFRVHWEQMHRYEVYPKMSSLTVASYFGLEFVVRLLLMKNEVDPDSQDEDGRTPLLWAAENGREAVVKLLLETGRVDVDSKSKSGWTPLLWAARNGHEAVVKLLLETDSVDVDSKSEYGQTPLSWAAGNGHEAVVKLLLETGRVDVDSKDSKYGQTPLSLAAGNGREAVVKLLLETGRVDVDSKDSEYGWTPLWLAAGNGHEAVVKLLQSSITT